MFVFLSFLTILPPPTQHKTVQEAVARPVVIHELRKAPVAFSVFFLFVFFKPNGWIPFLEFHMGPFDHDNNDSGVNTSSAVGRWVLFATKIFSSLIISMNNPIIQTVPRAGDQLAKKETALSKK